VALNITGSFAVRELQKIFGLRGAAQPNASDDVQLTLALDPQRLSPYGPWKTAGVGLQATTTFGQNYTFGVINPATSGAYCIVRRVQLTTDTATLWTSAIKGGQGGLHASSGGFTALDDGDTSTGLCPINWFSDANAAVGGQVFNQNFVQANTKLSLIEDEFPLFPGAQATFFPLSTNTQATSWAIIVQFANIA
jgi:hypothetical protein